MNMPIYSAALGAALMILQLVLMLSVGFHRVKTSTLLGVGDDKDLERKFRRHANLAENSGLFLAVLALLEILAGQTWYVKTLCGLFLFARLAHAAGFSSLAGSHGKDPTGARKLFMMARGLGAFGTLATGVGAVIAIAVNLA